MLRSNQEADDAAPDACNGHAEAVMKGVNVSSALLSHTLENLMAEHPPDARAGFAVTRLSEALIDADPEAGQACIDRLLDCGVGVQAIYDTYIPQSAHQLGRWWTDDRVGFGEVTLGMARLTEIFRRVSPTFLKGAAPRRGERTALFALVPGETHSLGIAMAADYFQRAGWAVRVELRAGIDMLADLARSQSFDLVGVSAASRRQIPVLTETVGALRSAVAPNVRIVIGGPLTGLEPAIAEQVRADRACTDAASAVALVESDF